ncbi:MAG: molybdenum cofactor guanylyltransferase [Fluviicola sp.]
MSYSGIILAGGKSSRMGQDKALMELKGIPMLQQVANGLKNYCNEIIIASNEQKHHAFGDIGVSDNYQDSGPLAGLEAGLLAASNESCIVISCDAPLLTTEILDRLISETDQRVIVASCSGRVHPLIGIYTKGSLEIIQSQLEKKQLKMHDVLDALNAKCIDFPKTLSEAFQNINTQEEWEQLTGK